jgi:hypothetical protein
VGGERVRAPVSNCTAASVRAARAAPVLLPPAGHLDGVTTSHRANGMNPVRTIALYRNKGSGNIDAIKLSYNDKVRRAHCASARCGAAARSACWGNCAIVPR